MPQVLNQIDNSEESLPKCTSLCHSAGMMFPYSQLHGALQPPMGVSKFLYGEIAQRIIRDDVSFVASCVAQRLPKRLL
jgi:hypothetical protein